jgi:hypothetical protein
MFEIRDIVVFALAAGLLAGGALSAWPWARQHARNVVAGIATTVGFAAWNITLNITNATGFNVDAPVIPLSWADVGSGVLSFTVTALVLGLVWDRREPAERVVGAAGIAGAMAILLDLFVL